MICKHLSAIIKNRADFPCLSTFLTMPDRCSTRSSSKSRKCKQRCRFLHLPTDRLPENLSASFQVACYLPICKRILLIQTRGNGIHPGFESILYWLAEFWLRIEQPFKLLQKQGRLQEGNKTDAHIGKPCLGFIVFTLVVVVKRGRKTGCSHSLCR